MLSELNAPIYVVEVSESKEEKPVVSQKEVKALAKKIGQRC